MMKRWVIFLLALCLVLACAPSALAAQMASFTLRVEKGVAAPGETIQLLLSCAADEANNLSAFRLRLPFEENQVQFRGIAAKGGLTKSELQTNVQDGVVTVVYLTGREGLPIGKEETPLLTVTFTVLSDMSEEELFFAAEVDGACSYDLTPYALEGGPSVSAPVEHPPEADQQRDAFLRALQPDTGALVPEFGPERFSYTLEVPYTVTSVLFYAEPLREGAAVKVNRKNLGAMGSSTDFTVTVTSPDQSQKQIYEISVKRGVKPAAGRASSSSGEKTPSSRPVYRGTGGPVGAASGKWAASSASSGLGRGGQKAAGAPQTGNGQEMVQLPFRTGGGGSFFLGIAAAACIGAAAVLLFWRKKHPKEENEQP